MDRLAAGAGSGRQLAGDLDRAVPGLDVDDHPAGDEVLRLGERAVDDRGAPLAVVKNERAVGRQRLTVDVLAGALEAGGESRMYPMWASASSGVQRSIGGNG